MISEQLGCDMPEALSRLIVAAAERGVSLDDAALDVHDRILRFDR